MLIKIFELLCGLHRFFLYLCGAFGLPTTRTKAFGPFPRSRSTGIILPGGNITFQQLELGDIPQRLR
jgi:hypothetical protein